MCLTLQGTGVFEADFPSLDLSAAAKSLTVGSRNSHASQSSNSGCEGVSTRVPKSSGVVTNPWPKYSIQMRFAMARVTVGLRGSTIHSASPNRLRGAPSGNGFRNEGTSGCTSSPGRVRSPRLKIWVTRGCVRWCRTNVVGAEGQPANASSICLFNPANSGADRRNTLNNSRFCSAGMLRERGFEPSPLGGRQGIYGQRRGIGGHA